MWWCGSAPNFRTPLRGAASGGGNSAPDGSPSRGVRARGALICLFFMGELIGAFGLLNWNLLALIYEIFSLIYFQPVLVNGDAERSAELWLTEGGSFWWVEGGGESCHLRDIQWWGSHHGEYNNIVLFSFANCLATLALKTGFLDFRISNMITWLIWKKSSWGLEVSTTQYDTWMAQKREVL